MRVRRHDEVQRGATPSPTTGISELQRIDAGAEHLDRRLSPATDGKLRGSLPKVNSTTLSSTMPPATVAISQALEPRSRERPHQRALDQQAEQRAQQQRQQRWPSGIGQPSVTREGVAQHRAEHHRRCPARS